MLIPALAALLLATPTLRAQEDPVNLDFFRPHTDAYGYFHTSGALTLGNLQMGLGAWTHLANDPLVMVLDGERVNPTGEPVTGDTNDAIVDSRVVGNLHAGMGFTNWFSISADLPVVFFQSGYDLAGMSNPLTGVETIARGGLEDLRLVPKGILLNVDDAPIGLGLMMPFTVPIGGDSGYLSEGAMTAEPGLVAEYADGSVRKRDYKIRSACNLGYRFQKQSRIRDLSLNSGLTWGLAAGFHPIQPLELVIDLHGALAGASAAQSPTELLGGAKLLAGRYVSFDLGGGAALVGGVGAPDYRLFFGATIAPTFDPNARDQDEDEIVDGRDRCPREPEDIDGYQDTDGCPDTDNDADQIMDDLDQCPNDPEDDDGFMDNDGCPDSDNDKDTIPDVSDRCPNELESINGYDDQDGCPDEIPILDTDGDGYDDDIDRCPMDAEDFDGDRDEDGCPDEASHVVITEDALEISEVIYFDTGKSTIQERSDALIEEIASVVKAHTELKKIRIEGHTDNVGADVANLKLSQARADAVEKALIALGVEAERLDAVGFGAMRPLVPNSNDENRSKNRRVEFIIVSRQIQRIEEAP